jgi:hypothetical protein
MNYVVACLIYMKSPKHTKDNIHTVGSLRATSHTRLRARDHYTSSTLIGGKGGVCECNMDVESTWILTWHRMDHVSWSLGLFSKTTFWG